MKKFLSIFFMCSFVAVVSAFGQNAAKTIEELTKQLEKNPDNVLSYVENRDSENRKLESVKAVYILDTDAEVAKVKGMLQKLRPESTKYTIERGAIVVKVENPDIEISAALITDLNSMRAMETKFLLTQVGVSPKAVVIIKYEYDD